MDYHVFYHSPCNDGELSRVIWEHFEPNSLFFKWIHQTTHEDDINIINNLPNKSTIVFLDTTPSFNIINKLTNKHDYIIIDHHKNPIITLVENKINLPDYNILLYVEKGFLSGNPDNNKLSGCKLTWSYFSSKEYPEIVYYIGSKDVWDFSNPNTETFCQGFNEFIKNLDEKDKFILIHKLLDKNQSSEFINIGNDLIEKYKKEAINIFKYYDTDMFNSLTILDVKCSNTNLYKYLIDFAQNNFDDADILRILHLETDTILSYSLRSLKDVNVDEMARYYGGNGHEKAAGYTIRKHVIQNGS